ncbi:MAG: SUMF1/EgtB/PvdO family nonheme iron enzyme [Nitrospira sp.]
MKIYKAFVSSTFEDLKNHRAHVIRSLRRTGFFVDPMEDWPADSDEPKQFSQDRLDGCHLCILLVAFRRGYVPDGETRSVTQLEYDSAIKKGIEILPFLLKEDSLWWPKFDQRKEDSELVRWRHELEKTHGRECFTHEPASIDMTGALGRWLVKKGGSTKLHKVERIEWRDGESPYPGLFSFDQHYAPMFFGRDREVDEILTKLSNREGRFLLMSGASGSGKSSLIGAGVWRALLQEGRLPGSDHWVWLRLQPGDGQNSFNTLSWGLRQAFPRIAARPDELATQLAGNPTALGELLTVYLAHGQELLLFLDQLEELFTRDFKDEEVKTFLDQLVVTARNTEYRLRVVATVRSEFIVRLEESEAILQVLNAGYHYHLGPVSPRMLQEMIEHPAHATGYEFEAGLVEQMLHDAALEPGSLPLVAYALAQLFERRRERTFTCETYHAIGGVAGAIGTKADQTMQTISEPGHAFDRVFAELVHLERDRPPTRKRADLTAYTYDQDAMRLILALAAQDCRVLTTGAQGSSLEVAHEKLFTGWPRLEGWIKTSSETLRLIDHATESAWRWHERGRNLEELWPIWAVADARAALQRFGKQPVPQLNQFLWPQSFLAQQLLDDSLSHDERWRIGTKLAEFGDVRKGVGLTADGVPDLDWVEIPSGEITLSGIDQVFKVQRFRMARYQVTNAQFEMFLRAADGYGNDKWWNGIQRPDVLAEPERREPNGPRETVSWFEAVAFCRWLSHRTGLKVRLPAEWEWQQAATGGDVERKYPWSGGWDMNRCNSKYSELGRTTAVGMYPSGASMQGLMDMTGNVWEWCLNTYDRPGSQDSCIVTDDPSIRRAIRGGSWFCSTEFLHVPLRDSGHVSHRYGGIGFRLAQDIEI